MTPYSVVFLAGYLLYTGTKDGDAVSTIAKAYYDGLAFPTALIRERERAEKNILLVPKGKNDTNDDLRLLRTEKRTT